MKIMAKSRAVREGGNTDFKVIFALFMVHFIGDFYMSFISPLLPVLADKFSLSMTQVGMVTGIVVTMAFIVQPSVGYLSDRYQTRFFVLGGPAYVGYFHTLIRLGHRFFFLFCFLPCWARSASPVSSAGGGHGSVYAGRRLGLSMALFILGGTVAFGVGPLFVTLFITHFGLTALPWSALLGVIIVGLVLVMIPRPESEGFGDLGVLASIKQVLYPVRKELSILLAIIVMRTFVLNSVLTFTPVLFSREGFGLVSIGGITSTLTIAGAVSGLLAGHFADRIGYKPVFLISYLLTPPCLYLSSASQGQLDFSGFFSGRFFYPGHIAPGHGHGPDAGDHRQVPGGQFNDGSGLWHWRTDDPR